MDHSCRRSGVRWTGGPVPPKSKDWVYYAPLPWIEELRLTSRASESHQLQDRCVSRLTHTATRSLGV